VKTGEQINLGLSTYAEAHRFIIKHRWYGYFLIPIVLNLLLLGLFTYAGVQLSEAFITWFYNVTGLESTTTEATGFFIKVLLFVVEVVMVLLVLIVYMFIFRYIILILLSPLLAYLSEKTEKKLTGETHPFSFSRFVKDVLRGIRIAFKNGIKEVGFSILFLIAQFIPVLGFLAPVAIFLTESYFFGFSMMDYYHERHRLSTGASNELIKKYKWVAIANGAVFNLMVLSTSLVMVAFPFIVGLVLRYLLVIPVIALSIAPIYSVIAATMAAIKIRETGKTTIWISETKVPSI
jgi:CysZ protein